MAKPKTGLIMRSVIRQVACPACGVQPGEFCKTIDKREHQERTVAALVAPDPMQSPEAGKSQVQTAPAPVVDPLPASGSSGSPELKRAFEAIRRYDETSPAPMVAIGVQTTALVGCRVRLIVWHGPTAFVNEVGTLQSIDFARRHAEIAVEPDSESDRVVVLVQWGANDAIQVTGQ